MNQNHSRQSDRRVTIPPASPVSEHPLSEEEASEFSYPGGWWHPAPEGDLLDCDLCPRSCRIAEGKHGFCFVREHQDGKMVLNTYGRSTGFCIDPIEKKPLHHFHPGTPVLSFGTAGCNLGCLFCQNWTSSRSRQVEIASSYASPEAIVEAAKETGCQSIAFTYNDPVIWAEYAVDTARICRQEGIKTVAVTAGYITEAARPWFFEYIDAVNIDLKAFDERFYRELTGASLEPVKETLLYLARETDVWMEITNLVIPGENDCPEDIETMSRWIASELGEDVPVHFSAFHPDFKLSDRLPTPPETLLLAREVAVAAGLKYVYTGNIRDARGQTTYCPGCEQPLIHREGYQIVGYHLKEGSCDHCHTPIAGHFDEQSGRWGSRREPIDISRFTGRSIRSTRTSSPEKDNPKETPPISSRETPQQDLSAILSEKERISVFETAGQLVSATVLGKPLPDVAEQLGELGRQEVLGAFVSLKRSGQLRSCMGCLSERMPLQEAVKGASRRAAKEDPRFPEISPSELDRLDLEVWLLWGMQRVEAEGEDRIDAIEIGVHGVQIVYGTHRGLLLPGVAVDHQMDAESFLEAVCRKAGLPTDAWRDPQATLFVFHGIAVKGPLKALTDDPAKSGSSSSVPGPTREALSQLKEAARQNFLVMLEGGTPNYFFPGIYDGNVAGLTLSVELPDRDPILCSKISVRSNIPLQATLFDFVKSVQRAIQQSGALEHALLDAVFDLTIFWDVVLHGKAERPDIEGFDPSRRAMMLATVSGWVIEFDPEATPEQLLERAFERTEEANPQESSVYSFEAISTSVPMETSSIPKPVLGPKRRPPAVAGAFYPATKEAIDAELNHMLEPEVLPEKTDRLPEKDGYVAAMVPHAGWIYSGKLAAMTLSRVDFPDRILVFAPKHRQGGAAWAVAPHDLWELPGHEVPSDPEFAKEMAAAVPAFRLDAAAHQQEHSVEVQLPILHRLAPHAKVIGTTLHGGSHAVLQEAADQLARFLETLETPPLLVISTDMNHYANEDLTRRVDRMAIDAIEAIDPEGLLETVRSNRISMCGVVPAVLVLETLLAMGKLNECHTVGYTTSAAASGDTERVVGYAGMLFR